MPDPSMRDGKYELFVFLPDDVRAFVAENGVDLAALLRNEGIDVSARHTVDPGTRNDGARDLILALVGTAAVITALMPALIRIVEAIASRPVVVSEVRLRPVETLSGAVVRGQDGNPLLHWVDERRVIGHPIEAQPQAVNLAAMGLKFSYSSGSATDQE